LPDHPDLAVVDADFFHLFSSWFNRGFLVLQRMDWRTPAALLEKIIAYEAVHEIGDWDALRRRLAPDRRCFGFFHPALVDEPLIFVEVALVKSIATRIQPLIDREQQQLDVDSVDSAIFYSISNCQHGLKGISFGNFLIKQVVAELQKELPQLKQFVTLSPIPGFMRWLSAERKTKTAGGDSGALSAAQREQLTALDEPGWHADARRLEALRAPLLALAAQYFLQAKTADGKPLDPVARFHLGNGARLEQINFAADLFAKGLQQAAGMMVNYAYRLPDIERNHEAYANHNTVVAASAVRKLLRVDAKTKALAATDADERDGASPVAESHHDD
jgi:malonyl-CoA decarboxylase